MRIISRPFLDTILRKSAAVTWQAQPWARRHLRTTQKSRDFNGKPNSNALPDVASEDRVRFSFHRLWPGPSDGAKQVNQFM
jgi:hypothetical protein